METPSRRSPFWLNLLALVTAALAVALVAYRNTQGASSRVLLSLSYNPTRELFRDVNPGFVKAYEKETDIRLSVKQSDSGPAKQLQSNAGSFTADVVTAALPSDVGDLQRKGLIATGWADRLPGKSQPYTSTIVFGVRKGNPKGIHDWPDLVGKGVTVITPNPKTSGNGKLSVLAAWGSVVHRGGTDASAFEYLKQLYSHVPKMDASAGDAATTFVQEKTGDVHLAWENEALREAAETHGEYEVVYPPVSIRAEPAVAWVDTNVARHGTESYARAYLQFFFTRPAQEMIAEHGFRPVDADVLRNYAKRFHRIDLFPVTAVARDWDDAAQRFFSDGGVFDSMHSVPLTLTATLTAKK